MKHAMYLMFSAAGSLSFHIACCFLSCCRCQNTHFGAHMQHMHISNTYIHRFKDMSAPICVQSLRFAPTLLQLTALLSHVVIRQLTVAVTTTTTTTMAQQILAMNLWCFISVFAGAAESFQLHCTEMLRN